MIDPARNEKSIIVGELEFRVADGLMQPHEVFFASARRYFAEGELERSLALADAFRSIDGRDPAAIALAEDIRARGVTATDIPPAVARAVAQEVATFAAMPAAIRERPIRPEHYIAIHPFLPGARRRLKRWHFTGSVAVMTRVVAPGSDLWDRCERVEYETFTAPDTGYFPANDCRRIPDFDHYDRQEFIAAMRTGRVVGTMRLVYAERARLAAGMFQTYDHRRELNLFPARQRYLESLDPRKIVDLATMAIDRRERTTRIYMALISRTIRRVWETDRRHVLACIDTPFYRKLKRQALDFRDLGPSTYYWGSPTTACILDTHAVPGGRDRLLIPYCRIRGAIDRLLRSHARQRAVEPGLARRRDSRRA